MKLTFEKITIKNFFSYGNQPTVIEFNKSASTLVIAQNGFGKTAALLDSIFFALFGEAFRSIKKSQIPNNINNKDTLVDLAFMLDNTKYQIVRGIKPDVFQVIEEGNEIWTDLRPSDKQKSLMDLLKFDAITLKNLILISEENVPFMRLSGPDRRAFVERVLNLTIFTDVHNIVKAKVKNLKDPYVRLKSNIDSKQEVIDRLNRIIENSDSPDKSVIDDCIEKIGRIEKFIEQAEPAIVKLKIDIQKLDDEAYNANVKSREAGSAVSRAQSNLELFKSGKCPTCHGEIESHKIEDFQKALDDAQNEKSEADKAVKEVFDKIAPLRSKLDAGQTKVSELKQKKWDLDSLKTKEESKTVANVDDELKEAAEELAVLLDEFADMKTDVDDFAELDKVLKTGNAKLPIISEYIPFFNQKINDHLERFGLQIFFELDSEFNETIRARYKDAFTYESFSTGQRSRIDFAILMTWRDIASKLSSMSTNLLIVDEFASKLDDNGFDAVSKALSELDANVFCIVPKEQKNMEFDRRLKISMHSGFSILEEV